MKQSYALKYFICAALCGLIGHAAVASGDPITTAHTAPVSPATHFDSPVTEATAGYVPAPNGLYPLWESNGLLLNHRHIAVSYLNASIGLGNRFQLGIRPSSFIFRTLNAYGKVALYAGRYARVALQVGGYVMLPGAGEAFLSSTYAAGLKNSDFTVAAIPATLATTYMFFPWLYVHSATTVMTIIGQDPVKTTAIFGSYLSVELLALKYNSIFFHAGEVGYWHHKFAVLGASYRFNYRWFEARAGYVYRYTSDGWQGTPLFDVGIIY